MGLSKSNRHKRMKTGALKSISCKKRKFHMARQPSNTKIAEYRVKKVRCRGGNIKMRALRLDLGNFICKSQNFIFKAKINQVMYHPSSNELMRTNTLTKSSVLKIDPQKFKEKIEDAFKADPELKNKDPLLHSNLEKDNLYAIISSRPGQCGSVQGYVLEGEELEFYMGKFKKRAK